MKRIQTIGTAAAVALTAAAIGAELRKPKDLRTWNGRVVGVPYDFRPPTVGKLQRTFWDPDNERILTPHVFGVGWGINVGRIARVVTRRV